MQETRGKCIQWWVSALKSHVIKRITVFITS